MRLSEYLELTISDYLCTECKNLIYFELGSNEDICVNPRCILFLPFLKFYDVSQADILKKQIKEKDRNLKSRIMKTDRSYFIRFLYQERKNITKKLITTGLAEFEKLLVVDELLILTNSLNFVGRKRGQAFFTRILKDYEEFFKVKNMIEDIENQRVLLSTNKKAYMLKYWKIILDFYKSYGLISDRLDDRERAFKYDFIDRHVRDQVKFEPGMDIGRLFEQQFHFISALKYVLERYHRTSTQYRYDPTGLDIAVLMGLFFSATKEIEFWSLKSLRNHFDRTASGKANFEEFIVKYINSKEKAPIIVFDGTTYIFDKHTLLFYIHYLIGKNRRKVEGQITTGEERIMKKKQRAASIFEEQIRKHLRECGYSVPSDPLVISEHKEKYEYDVIGVKEEKKIIYLVEAKYRDFSPSSLTGKTLIQQELMDEDNGLLIEAIKHQARLDFFYKHSDRFKCELSLSSPIDQYNVFAYIVTKHPPLISKYRRVPIVVYDDFYKMPL